MKVLDWAYSVKADLVALQRDCGIPAIWAAAQMCHESASDGGAALSTLASEHHNYAGLKFADWQRAYGAKPVNMRTNEFIDGEDVQVVDAFAGFASWGDWLQAYRSLLTGSLYRPALLFAMDPMLYGMNVARRGWATDPRYAAKVSEWMTLLWPVYQDTLPASRSQEIKPVPIRDAGGSYLCNGHIVLAEKRAYAPVRALAEALGLVVDFDEKAWAITLHFPGRGAE